MVRWGGGGGGCQSDALVFVSAQRCSRRLTLATFFAAGFFVEVFFTDAGLATTWRSGG